MVNMVSMCLQRACLGLLYGKECHCKFELNTANGSLLHTVQVTQAMYRP